ncbi:M23 family metallopeptidase [Sneathiella chinensis]|uniref:M23ase beta-sheet core domain-containing protein n=1 Tax=Sneathiella chinensis TaxID=349750 RepID=A0ABQ5U792_9PROT|nr:M23 family metallopeptidase [Sneathiella chinensis]GLQ07558.1 hypothetical protein GCM10007924_27790 [Sneathiella chinensis]
MKLQKCLEKVFSDRQIIVSSNSQLKSFTLTARHQVGMAVGASVVLGLVGFLGVQNSLQKSELALQENTLAQMQDKVRTVSLKLMQEKVSLARTQGELEQQYARLEDILTERKALEHTLQEATTDLKSTETALDSRDQYARELEKRISMLSAKLKHTNTRSEDLSLQITKINKELYHTAAERDQIAKDQILSQKKLGSLKRELQLFQTSKDQIYNDLQQAKQQLSAFHLESREQKNREKALQAEITDLKSRLASIATENRELITRVHEQAEQSIVSLKETITLTGLNPDTIFAPDLHEGRGGPYLAFRMPDDLLKAEQDYYEDAAKMELMLAKWTTLNSLMNNIPLARPTDVGYVSSSFGTRRDPIKKKKSFHAGIDIAGPKNTAVYSTAPGQVKVAGYKPAYGVMVEIDHGQGFVTRYGHLKKTYVKKGDIIDFRTKIGLMGSTGRSTGRHVHYEIMYNGKHQDPANFFKAGNYAFKPVPKPADD